MIKDGYTRVSSVLAPFAGLHMIPPQILANAAERGTRVHSLIDADIHGFGKDVDEDIKGFYESFLAWKGDKNFIVPHRFYDDHLKITGEVDCMYSHKNLSGQGFVLVDFKTPAKESPTWIAQASAYTQLAERCGFKIINCQWVQLMKDGSAAKVFDYKIPNPAIFNELFDVYKKYFSKLKLEELEIEYL